jgi:hypothetical protein
MPLLIGEKRVKLSRRTSYQISASRQWSDSGPVAELIGNDVNCMSYTLKLMHNGQEELLTSIEYVRRRCVPDDARSLRPDSCTFRWATFSA